MSRDWMEEEDELAPASADVAATLAPERRRGGRPKGSTRSDRQQVALRIPQHVLDHFRQGGPGWQTRIIAVLEREAEPR
jgi:uncharacterized protein (DUF4415 family)